MASNHGFAPPRSPSKNRYARSTASCATSCASWSLRVIQRARLYAASRRGITTRSNRCLRSSIGPMIARASRRDANCPGHRLMALPAEVVAEELELADPVRSEVHAHDLPRRDVGAELEVGSVEAHEDVGGGEFEHHRLALLQLDLLG